MKRANKPIVITLPVMRATVIPLSGTRTIGALARKVFKALSMMEVVLRIKKNLRKPLSIYHATHLKVTHD